MKTTMNKKTWKPILAGVFAAACSLGGFALGSPTMAATLVVDKDLADCPNADFVSIQAAVAAAAPGDTIKVCPDLYTETVTVNKPLTLDGSGPDPRARTGDPTKEAVVQFDSGSGIFNLQSHSIVLRGFTLQGNAVGPGIHTSAAFSDYQIEKNLIRDNVFGLSLHNNGATVSVVEKNAFNNNNRPGSGSGDGIYSDQGLSNVVIQKNYFTGHAVAAMVLNSTGQTNLVVVQNDLVNDNTIVLFNAMNSLISHNRSSNPGGTGIFIGGGVSDSTISHNHIVGASNGISVNNQFFPAPNENLRITQNQVFASQFDGIRLNNADNNTVAQNHVKDSGRDGIHLLNDSDDNVVEKNHVTKNVRDGIRVETDSSGNAIVQNHMMQNGEYDAHDDTVGAGTAGTANFWFKNQFKSDKSPGRNYS